MKTFACQACAQPVYFESARCPHCGATLGFLPDELRLSALREDEDGLWTPHRPTPKLYRPGFLERLFGARPQVPTDADTGTRYRRCANGERHNVCNWMVPADSDETWCPACRTNRTIPNLARPGNLERWQRIECGKRRLVYSLMRLGLPLPNRQDDPERGLAFDFLSSRDMPYGQPVATGYANGLVTLNIDEADPAGGERRRVDIAATTRTQVGRFRYEIGHYYWDRLIRDGDRLEEFRTRFGDEREDHAAALDAHDRNGPPADWQERYIVAHASSHPREDWAETWAHYLHIVDTLETAAQFGIEAQRRLPDGTLQCADLALDPYVVADFAPIADNWPPIAFALDSLNRSLGQQDLYPFALSPAAIDKLAYVHRTIRETAAR